MGLEEISTVSVYNLTGKLLISKKVNNNEFLAITVLPKGIYVVSVADKNGVIFTTKFIKNIE